MEQLVDKMVTAMSVFNFIVLQRSTAPSDWLRNSKFKWGSLVKPFKHQDTNVRLVTAYIFLVVNKSLEKTNFGHKRLQFTTAPCPSIHSFFQVSFRWNWLDLNWLFLRLFLAILFDSNSWRETGRAGTRERGWHAAKGPGLESKPGRYKKD